MGFSIVVAHLGGRFFFFVRAVVCLRGQMGCFEECVCGRFCAFLIFWKDGLRLFLLFLSHRCMSTAVGL